MIAQKKMNNNAAYKQQLKFRLMIGRLERINTKKVRMNRSKTPSETSSIDENKKFRINLDFMFKI